MKLITEVRDDSLTLRFHPLTNQIIPYEHIKTCEVRKYHPIREYGGWGIRYGRKGKAFNVSGNLGVQLELAQGKSLLIGSQRPEELARAIQQVHVSKCYVRDLKGGRFLHGFTRQQIGQTLQEVCRVSIERHSFGQLFAFSE